MAHTLLPSRFGDWWPRFTVYAHALAGLRRDARQLHAPLRRALGAARLFVRTMACGVRGHDYRLHTSAHRICLRCADCEHETPGWRIDPGVFRRTPPPRVTPAPTGTIAIPSQAPKNPLTTAFSSPRVIRRSSLRAPVGALSREKPETPKHGWEDSLRCRKFPAALPEPGPTHGNSTEFLEVIPLERPGT
jgi:hypothetical protein